MAVCLCSISAPNVGDSGETLPVTRLNQVSSNPKRRRAAGMQRRCLCFALCLLPLVQRLGYAPVRLPGQMPVTSLAQLSIVRPLGLYLFAL